MLGGPPVIRAWLLQHFVEEAMFRRGSLSILAIRHGDKVVVVLTLLPF